MRNRLGWIQFRELALTAVPVLLVIVAAFWAAAQFVAPGPPKELTIATSSKGSPYYEAAQRYRAVLAESGVTLNVLETRGSLENLRLIGDAASPVAAAFIQGGLAGSKEVPDIRSLGRVFYEPIWIFHHQAISPARLSELVGRRILIGPAGSGTDTLARRLLRASGVTADNAVLINMELPAYVEALDSGSADAGLLVLAPEARSVRRLLDSPNVRLMNMAQAEAYVQRFPFLVRLELKRGVVDFARDQPPADTTLLATTTALVMRADLHPALAYLLAEAALHTHAPPRLDASGEAAIFQRAGTFPIPDDQEFPLSEDAVRVYKSGPPFLQRYLPFWLATLADRLFVLLLPALGILLPAFKAAPALYAWRIQQRIRRWYRELMRVDAEITARPDGPHDPALLAEIERIEQAVNRLPIPLPYANQLFDLREHIEVVQRRMRG